MPTTKTRINVSVPDEIGRALTRLAKRDRVPKATKAARLIAAALEVEEDILWDEIAKKRDRRESRFILHKKVWA